MSAHESLASEAKRIQETMGHDSLTEYRERALKDFEDNGFPSLKNEHWKYTDVGRIAKKTFSLEKNIAAIDEEKINAARFNDFDCYEVVFVNGHYQASLSHLEGLPDNVIISDIETAIAEHADLLEKNINLSSDERTLAFSALNSAFLNQGCFVYIPNNQTVTKPIHILFVSSANDELVSSQPRNVIVLSDNAEATVVESYIGLDDSSYFTNTVTELRLHQDSRCKHYKIQQESTQAYHIGSLKVMQHKNSRLDSNSISLGGALTRNDIHSQLSETGAEIIMNGLYVANHKQHVDNHTFVEHLVPHTYSNEVYRGVLDGQGRGVFNGKVIVHKDAQKIEAYQSNANLLLSDTAEVDTKPELEIYADDVKCSHGATIGQLDENMLFYLRSRAIDEETAKSLLTFAFAEEVIKEISLEPIRQRLESSVIGKLPDADIIQEFTHE